MQLRHLLSLLLVVPSALVLSAPVRVPDSVESLYSRAVSVTVEAGPKGDFKKFAPVNQPQPCGPQASPGLQKQNSQQCAKWQKDRAQFLTMAAADYKADIETLLSAAQASGIAVPSTLTVYVRSGKHTSKDPKAHITIDFQDPNLCKKKDCVAHVRTGGTGQLYGGDPHKELFQNVTPTPSPSSSSSSLNKSSGKRSPSPQPASGGSKSTKRSPSPQPGASKSTKRSSSPPPPPKNGKK